MGKELNEVTVYNLSPKVKKINVGIRKYRQVTIYPLSVKDESEAVEILSVFIDKIANTQLSDFNMFELMASEVRENLEKFIKMVTDESDEVTTADFDNDTLVLFVECLWEMNFETSLKKFRELWNKVKTTSLFQSLFPKYSEKPVIDLTTSIVSPSEKEDQPLNS